MITEKQIRPFTGLKAHTLVQVAKDQWAKTSLNGVAMNKSYFQHIFKGTTWKWLECIRGPSPQRLRAHHDLLYTVWSAFFVIQSMVDLWPSLSAWWCSSSEQLRWANCRQGQQQVFTLCDCRSLKACSGTQVLLPVLTLIQEPPAKQTNKYESWSRVNRQPLLILRFQNATLLTDSTFFSF